MPPKLPQNVLEMRGRSHQTKAEKEERRASEPQLEEIKRLRAPDYLPEFLRKDFNEIGQELIKAGLLSKLDRDVLAQYIMSRDAWAAAHLKARAALDMDDPKESTSWARVAKTYFDQCHVCASGMGLTISSRCRLVVPKVQEPEEDAMTKMLRERAERRKKA